MGSRVLSNTLVDDEAKTTKVTYGNGDTALAAYSDSGLLLSQSANGSEQYKWQYDSSGNVYKYTDKLNGLYSNYDYDTMNRVSTKTVYGSNRQQKSITSYSYDLKGNVTNKTDGMTIHQDYAYTKDNLASKTQMTSTQYYDYGYDSLNRLNKKALHLTDKTVNINYSYSMSDRNAADESVYRTRRLYQEIIMGYW